MPIHYSFPTKTTFWSIQWLTCPTSTFTLTSFDFNDTSITDVSPTTVETGLSVSDFSSPTLGFATDIVFANQAILNGTTSAQSIDLTAPEFNNLTSIELRIVLDDRQGNSNNNSGTFIDNVEVLGSVQSIPEPSSALLLALGGLTLAGRRKR